MVLVAREDVLNGLKRFKRLAKQDFLASSLTSDPAFWTAQAEARRQTYDELAELVSTAGVEEAYERAKEDYLKLISSHSTQPPDPHLRGKEQALEMFFTLLGVDHHQLKQEGQSVSKCALSSSPPSSPLETSTN
ncbi:MAG: hypothetical protein QJR13_06030 [Bacillota bacterium]|nr:hypothetical protein [Bacillota bacterium]